MRVYNIYIIYNISTTTIEIKKIDESFSNFADTPLIILNKFNIHISFIEDCEDVSVRMMLSLPTVDQSLEDE